VRGCYSHAIFANIKLEKRNPGEAIAQADMLGRSTRILAGLKATVCAGAHVSSPLTETLSFLAAAIADRWLLR
jgi:hypothetical protein